MSSRKSDKSKKSHNIVNISGSSSSAHRSTSKKEQGYGTINTGLDIVANIAEASDILAPLKAACRTTKSILEVVQAIESNQEEWTDLTRRLKEYMSALEERTALFETYPLGDRAVDEVFSRPLIHYVEFLEDMHDMVVDLRAKRSRNKLGFLNAFSKVKIDAGEIRKLNREIEDRHRLFMEALGVFTALRVQVVERNTEATRANVEAILTEVDAAAILQLPTVAFVASSVHRTCLKGTREAVLQMIREWAHDDTSDKSIFWLCDIAGSGKSTVAMSAMDAWRKEGVLGGRFFFSMASSDGSTTDKFCSTIARDLVHFIPELTPSVAEAVKRNPSFMRSSIDEQFQTLVVGPLNRRKGRVILVLDALDECKSGSQRRELLETLSKAVQESKNLRIFMTSRPDPVIQGVLGSLSIKAKLNDRLHDVNHRDNVNDIAFYVHQSLDGVLPHDKRQRLVGKANGLFIWASTACRMLTSETTMSTPESIYNRLISLDQTGAIDEVYDLIFERTDPQSHEVMCKMLAVLLVAFEPLTIDDLEHLLKQAGISGSGKALLQNLGSVLIRDTTTDLIQFRHPTLVEYLRRCTAVTTVNNINRIHINIAHAHGQAALWCLKCLRSRTEGLRFNICQIQSSFYLNRQLPDLDVRVSKFITRRIRYASSHWLFHAAQTNLDWQRMLKDELQHIIKSPYVLYWMEILSFTGGVSRAIAGLRALTRQTGLEEEIRTSAYEIRRFLIAFSVPILDSTPHIYISALPFTPKTSILHDEGIKFYRNSLVVTQGLDTMYPKLPNILRGHEDSVNAVIISPDGSRIISGSDDETIRLWDVDTGQPLGEPLRGHEDSVKAVAISPDGSQIVSGSSDETIRLWDAESGKLLAEPFQGHESVINAVAFSPDGSRIVSSSADKTIRLWDVDTGHWRPLRGRVGDASIRVVVLARPAHESSTGSSDNDGPTVGSRDSVAFSPDGSRVVSGSEDMTIRLWDVETGQPFGKPLRAHQYSVLTVAFSPDGVRIASGSSDRSILIWDANTGQLLRQLLQAHGDSVLAVSFSPDCSKVVSSSFDNTVRLWDPVAGRPLGESLRGHEDSVLTVAFSPDGSRIASGSEDMTVRLWVLDTGEPSGEPLQGHDAAVECVTFSPDGSRIVSGSRDGTIRLWNADTGQRVLVPLQGHEGGVNVVAYSPGGPLIASGSDDGTIRTWNAITGEPLGKPLQGHEDSVLAVAFSPDASRIVSGSNDRTIRLWDIETGQQLGEPFIGHSKRISAVLFSLDGSQIVSGSADGTIRLWNTNTSQPFGEPLQVHKYSVLAVGLSPDGSRIVSGSEDKTIQIWDMNTGRSLGQPLRGHEDSVLAVAFSPDGSRVISGSKDRTIMLWDAGMDINTRNDNQNVIDPTHLGLEDDPRDTHLKIHVPGFEQCSLLPDGWVQSSGRYLFWVPPDNRHGLLRSHLLTIPTASSLRATRLDFTHFQCGPSWTIV
ncbi:hypothetical protein PIIN_09818 [Serendipita indica DSM 11827]|uniref:Nephrocystin 3-like N-terminal domain-containing protein n=1 Tax=Serendipita indica (strain DSM 11827) TaxID=1109443 RepID=G4TWY7_SERID|nr:hypothetical protein PIIN_09818 [Serendipita indica DSM 11827]